MNTCYSDFRALSESTADSQQPKASVNPFFSIFYTRCSQIMTPPLQPTFVNKVLLEHSHAHSFTYFSMAAFEQSLKVAAESIWSTKPELCGILTKMAF